MAQSGTAGPAKRYVYIWEFRVTPGQEHAFLAAYGPNGDWAGLFRRAPGYLETLLLQDQSMPGRYVTVDRWASATAHDDFRARFGQDYDALDRACEALTQQEASLGSYWELA